jgi:hypothetical protein
MKSSLDNYGAKPNKAKIIAVCIKSATGVIGGSLVLSQGHPYIALTVLAMGAIANEIINLYKWN